MPPLNGDFDDARDFVRFHLAENGLSTAKVGIVPFFGPGGEIQNSLQLHFPSWIALGTYGEIFSAIAVSRTWDALREVCIERKLLRPKMPFPTMMAIAELHPLFTQLPAMRNDGCR